MMKNDDSKNVCPKCGASVPADAPQGLCPKCVLAGAATNPDAGSSATAAGEIPSLERVAAAFPQLEVLELIGRGGMGFVFEARQPHLDRSVALKLLPDKLARDPHFAERFNREGRVLAKLNHPNIVSVFDFGRTEHFYFLLMEYVDGVNLRQAMQAGRFSPSEALAIVPKICEALQCAHEQGVLHRDIKPENILLDARGRVKIADFGIAKLVGKDRPAVTLTGTGAALGTPHYMAPEQLEKPSEVDERADIYSLGVVFYEMLTGELPIGRFAPPSKKTPVSEGVDQAVFRALEKDRERRQRSASEFQTEVQTAAGKTGPSGTLLVSAPPTPSHPDFLLCHPALPRMAQAITVYALIAAPALWLLGLLSLDPPRQANSYVTFVDLLTLLVALLGSSISVVLWVIGGVKLRALKRSGPRFILTAIAVNVLATLLSVAGTIWAEAVAPESDVLKPSAGEALLAVMAMGALVFEIAALVWLLRNRTRLSAIFQQVEWVRRPRSDQQTTGSVVGSTFSRKAIWATALSGLALILLVGSWLLARLGGGGIGPAELVLLGVPGAGCALAGTILGWVALNEIRDRGGKISGLPLALLAALAWPLFTVAALALFPPYLIQVPDDGTGRSTVTSPRWLLLPMGVIAFVLWSIHAAVRWATGQPVLRRAGPAKWVFAVLIVAVLSWGYVNNLHTHRGSNSLDSARETLMLNEGMVELVALSQHPSTGVWWEPDGSLSADGPFENPGVTYKAGADERAVEMVFRTHGLPPQASSPQFELDGHSGWGGGSEVKRNGQAIPNSHLIAAAFPRSLRRTTVRVGVALDAWETLAESGSNVRSEISLVRDGRPVKVTWLGAHEKGSTTVVLVGFSLQDMDARIVALAADGTEHPSLLSNRTRAHLEAEFVNLQRAQIVDFRLQVRPYRWAVFKNVALVPREAPAAAAQVESSQTRERTADAKARQDAVTQASERLESAIASLDTARVQFTRQQITQLELLTAECRRDIAHKLLDEVTEALANPEPNPQQAAAERAAAASRLQSALQRLEAVKRDVTKGTLAEGDLRLLEAEAAIGVARAEVQGDRLAAARVREEHARKARERVERLRELGKASDEDVAEATLMELRSKAFVLALEEFR